MDKNEDFKSGNELALDRGTEKKMREVMMMIERRKTHLSRR